jgi:hypothetical protein
MIGVRGFRAIADDCLRFTSLRRASVRFYFGDCWLMRFSARAPKGIWTLFSLPLMMFAPMIAGCDSTNGPPADSAESKAAAQARQDAIKAQDEKATAAAQKKGGKNVELKSIKGGIKNN